MLKFVWRKEAGFFPPFYLCLCRLFFQRLLVLKFILQLKAFQCVTCTQKWWDIQPKTKRKKTVLCLTNRTLSHTDISCYS